MRAGSITGKSSEGQKEQTTLETKFPYYFLVENVLRKLFKSKLDRRRQNENVAAETKSMLLIEKNRKLNETRISNRYRFGHIAAMESHYPPNENKSGLRTKSWNQITRRTKCWSHRLLLVPEQWHPLRKRSERRRPYTRLCLSRRCKKVNCRTAWYATAHKKFGISICRYGKLQRKIFNYF